MNNICMTHPDILTMERYGTLRPNTTFSHYCDDCSMGIPEGEKAYRLDARREQGRYLCEYCLEERVEYAVSE